MQLQTILFFLLCVPFIFADPPTPTKKLIHFEFYSDNTACGNEPTDITYVDQYCYLGFGNSSTYYFDNGDSITSYFCIKPDCTSCYMVMEYPKNECFKLINDSSKYFLEKKTLDDVRVFNRLSYAKSGCTELLDEFSFIEGQCYNFDGYGSNYGIVVKDTVEIFLSFGNDCKNTSPINYKLDECIMLNEKLYVKYTLLKE
ncbi:hypothetical protein M0813_27250 [Anaeramoeba flamelloides]|uniref:Uncharacterized protein n=1 Tax=Anaeramoeba flamelloides TaxID=1746091 RepID=A0ABQ8XYJ8_9EUKA|nr:hypothetical protein M0813_27250 [Anaeramoeba flamelloides]